MGAACSCATHSATAQQPARSRPRSASSTRRCTVVATLKGEGLYERSVIVVTSDNGAPSAATAAAWTRRSNFPLRGREVAQLRGRRARARGRALAAHPGAAARLGVHGAVPRDRLAADARAARGRVRRRRRVRRRLRPPAALFGAARGAEPAERRTTVPLLLTYLPVGDGGDGGNGAFVAELAPNTTFKLMLNAPDINWYGPNGATSGACVDGCTGWVDFEHADVPALRSGRRPVRDDEPVERVRVRRRAPRDGRRFCEAYLDMKPSVYQACNKTVFKSAFQANENYTTAVTDIASLGVYKSEYWSTPTIPNCTFSRFSGVGAQRVRPRRADMAFS